RNIRVIPPGLEATFTSGQILLPQYVEAIAPFSVLRFMNWQACNAAVNNSLTTSFDWDDRIRPTHYTQGSTTNGRGMALETIVAICNQRLIHPWFCWPLGLTDDYLLHAFEYIRDNLDPRLNAYH